MPTDRAYDLEAGGRCVQPTGLTERALQPTPLPIAATHQQAQDLDRVAVDAPHGDRPTLHTQLAPSLPTPVMLPCVHSRLGQLPTRPPLRCNARTTPPTCSGFGRYPIASSNAGTWMTAQAAVCTRWDPTA